MQGKQHKESGMVAADVVVRQMLTQSQVADACAAAAWQIVRSLQVLC